MRNRVSFNLAVNCIRQTVLHAIKEGKINLLTLLDDLKCNVEMRKNILCKNEKCQTTNFILATIIII